ncbi:MAG: hypothetical protein LBN42_03910 [Oscillospiraceae bacterium]|jgi:hypothetical protein|nr:hypothetical protein [Oscillospiraceae bacterium]
MERTFTLTNTDKRKLLENAPDLDIADRVMQKWYPSDPDFAQRIDFLIQNCEVEIIGGFSPRLTGDAETDKIIIQKDKQADYYTLLDTVVRG